MFCVNLGKIKLIVKTHFKKNVLNVFSNKKNILGDILGSKSYHQKIPNNRRTCITTYFIRVLREKQIFSNLFY